MVSDFHELEFTAQYTAITARWLRKPMDDAQSLARRYASEGMYSKGRLAESIYSRGPYIEGLRVYGTIGTSLSYARYVENGALPHPIFPKGEPPIFRFGSKRPKQLKFVWRGRTVYTPHVPMSPATIGISHPGMRGKHFLLRAITDVSIRYHMRLSAQTLMQAL